MGYVCSVRGQVSVKSMGCAWCERVGEYEVHMLLSGGTGDGGEREELSLSSESIGGLVALVTSFKAFCGHLLFN